MEPVVTDEFWLDAVRKCGSNGATDGFATLEELIASDRLDEAELRSLFSALRSLSQKAWDTASLKRDKSLRPWDWRDEL